MPYSCSQQLSGDCLCCLACGHGLCRAVAFNGIRFALGFSLFPLLYLNRKQTAALPRQFHEILNIRRITGRKEPCLSERRCNKFRHHLHNRRKSRIYYRIICRYCPVPGFSGSNRRMQALVWRNTCRDGNVLVKRYRRFYGALGVTWCLSGRFLGRTCTTHRLAGA